MQAKNPREKRKLFRPEAACPAGMSPNRIAAKNHTKYNSQERKPNMTYTNSPLQTYQKISPNRTSPRNHKIDTITIHCMAGNLSIETCGNAFSRKSRRASSNYGIGTDGRIAMYVEEKDRSWASSNASNDHRAVTIEVANDGGADTGWHISDRAMESLLALVTDICRRNQIKKLVWSTNKTNRVKHLNGCNMTVHRDFAAKACPGDYLYRKHPYIAEQVNKRLSTLPSVPSAVSGKFLSEGLDYSPVFDPVYYADRYADLKKTFGTDSAALFRHFCTYGMTEGRIACADFNVAAYKNHYADLRNAFGDELPLYYKHYITYGQKESRNCV